MSALPDLNDPRYLREVGWFIHHERFGPMTLGETFDEERTLYSQVLMDNLLKLAGRDRSWLEGKSVVSVGCGCTGDLATWPAAVKIALDPLVGVYRKLGMLVKDDLATAPTVYMAVEAQQIPLVDEFADVVICRNALDHMHHPEGAIQEAWRILKIDGLIYLAVDIGGQPTPDEPTIFTPESLATLLKDRFEEVQKSDKHPPYSGKRSHSVRILAKKRLQPSLVLSKEEILKAYMAQHLDD